MRPCVSCGLRWFSRDLSKAIGRYSVNSNFKREQIFPPDDKHTNILPTPGFFPPSLWSFHRPANANLEQKLFPHNALIKRDAGSCSNGVAHLSGKLVNDKFSYSTYQKFGDVPLDEKLQHNLSLLNLHDMTPVQVHTLPLLLADPPITEKFNNVGIYDLMAAAQTGSGKTLAYLLPILHRIMFTYPSDSMTAVANSDYQIQYPSALILAPTRELVHQIRLEASKLCYRTNVRPVALYGGEKPHYQMSEMGRGCHLVVATPGRLSDFLERRLLNLSFCRNLVIDEADRLLDMGFEPQLRKIIQSRKYGLPTDDGRQTALFSATFPPSVALLARDFLRGSCCISLNILSNSSGNGDTNGEFVVPVWGQAVKRNRFSSEDAFKQLQATVPKEITQEVQCVQEGDNRRRACSNKMLDCLVTALNSVLSANSQEVSVQEDSQNKPGNSNERVLVFCNTKGEVEQVDRYLHGQGFRSVLIHGDRSQDQRTRSVNRFRDGSANILVATSVVARGLDFPHVVSVINFGLPLGLHEYVHRIGRTGRMGQPGRAITIVSLDSINDDKHLQGVARGVCRLINVPSHLPQEFVRAANWKPEDGATEDDPESFYSSRMASPRSPPRMKKRSFKRW